MARPDSLTTRLRILIARRLEPMPDPGEAWCVGCSMNDGRTLVVSVNGIWDHAKKHEGGACAFRAASMTFGPGEDGS